MNATKRYERYGWTSLDQVGIDISLRSLNTALSLNPQSVYGAAWNKYSRVVDHSLVAVLYFALENDSSCRDHASKVIPEAEVFFFGSWRLQLPKPTKGQIIDEKYWKKYFSWMEVFEAVLLCASVLGEWEFLKKLGTFPEPDSHIDSDYGPQGRDLYVAFGAFLREAPQSEMNALLEQASAGPKKLYKLIVAVIRACVARDATLLQKSLLEYLKHYKKNEFPKEQITKKVSLEGTFFVHWAEKEKLPLTVPPEFEDHIVRLK